MRIVIEVDVSAEEIPLATHLFSALRAIADDVRARNLRPVFEALIARLRDPAELDSDPLDAFVAAFLHVVFETDLLAQKISVVPFMRLVPRLPDAAKVKMRDTLIPKILKFLTIKRSPDASRAEFFVHAEAFAALVHLEFVSIQGAVTTILTLLRKPDNRCAAVTMLGKTVELCAPQVRLPSPSLMFPRGETNIPPPCALEIRTLPNDLGNMEKLRACCNATPFCFSHAFF
ncbi:unnamed protein product [Closterium sp. Yama58-4]|nr:unnamed protein product [Closterium sp. Yama58-4]